MGLFLSCRNDFYTRLSVASLNTCIVHIKHEYINYSERSAFLKYKHFMNISDKMLELDRIYTIDQLSSYSGELFIAIHFLLFAVLYRECFAFISERKNLGYENELD